MASQTPSQEPGGFILLETNGNQEPGDEQLKATNL